MRESSNNTDAVSLETIITGSVIVTGTATATDSSTTAASTSLSSGLAGVTDIDGLTLTSYSTVVVGADSSASTQSQSQDGMIIGLAVGSVVLVGMFVIM